MHRFSTDEVCLAFLERVRWPDGPVCPKCGSVGRATHLRSRPGTWSCCVGSCKAQFSVTAGTPLHRTRVPLTKWFLAIWLISTSSKGVSGMKPAEWLDVDYRTAWYMGHRIRRLLSDPGSRKLSGVVEADEMYVGGRKKPEDDDPLAGSGGSKRGRGHGRATVLVAAERGGDVRARRISTHSSIEIGSAVRELIDPSAQLVTDGLPAYRRIGRSIARPVTINHGQRRFTDEAGSHVNKAEGFFGLFRRSVQGTWHWVSRKHLDAYTTECTWRHNRRDVLAARKFIQALSGLDAGPLGYRELVACG